MKITKMDPRKKIVNMTVNTRYVITNTEALISPAGFSPGTRVFRQTPIAIHCDEIPAKLPQTFGNLYLHDVTEMVKDY